MSAVLSPREAELLAQVQVRDGRLEELARENALLRQKVDALVRRLFGARSERLDPGQLLLLLQGTGAPVLSPPAPSPRASAGARPPRPRRRARLPEHLPVVEEVLDPEAVRACPGAWRRVGEEVSESLDYEPGRFHRRRLVRPKYVSRRGGGVGEASPFLIAPLPAGLLERGLAAPGLLAHVLVSKYGDHLPLYRQEQIYRQRHGVHLPRATLARWVELAAEWLRPVCEAMRRDVLAGGYVQVDETPVRYLCPGLGRAALGYLWTCARPGGDVIFDWRTGRGSGCLERIVPAGFAGVVQCDGFAAYPSFVARRSPHAGTITLAGCWAHVRRKFHEAQEQAPRLVGWLLGQIGQLYRVEARLRAARAGPRLRAATRAAESRAVVVRLHRALVVLKARRFLPRSLLGRAIDHALGQWSTLGVFLADGRVEIDNNGVENAIRPTAVGKKNWLFVGHAEAGQRSAILFSLARELPAPRRGALRLPARRADPAADDDQLDGRRVDPGGLGQGSPAAPARPPRPRVVGVVDGQPYDTYELAGQAALGGSLTTGTGRAAKGGTRSRASGAESSEESAGSFMREGRLPITVHPLPETSRSETWLAHDLQPRRHREV